MKSYQKWMLPISIILSLFTVNPTSYSQEGPLLQSLDDVRIFYGDDLHAYRDPAIFYDKDTFYLFFTIVEIEDNQEIYSYTAVSNSTDLRSWSKPIKITPRDQSLNYCSPGNVVVDKDEYVLCLQTYPRRNYTSEEMPRYADSTARIFTMRSKDLRHWSDPEILMVKGPNVPVQKMGRMIDPYLIKDNDNNRWWCFYKQNGASISYSDDLQHWNYVGHLHSGENISILPQKDKYIMFHSPRNGFAKKQSTDLKHWKDVEELITLGQDQWAWAKGRISAATVIDLRDNPQIKAYLMFFHGSGPLTEEQGDFDKNSSIGIAWSQDLLTWHWKD